jgi:hypothetical protein
MMIPPLSPIFEIMAKRVDAQLSPLQHFKGPMSGATSIVFEALESALQETPARPLTQSTDADKRLLAEALAKWFPDNWEKPDIAAIVKKFQSI